MTNNMCLIDFFFLSACHYLSFCILYGQVLTRNLCKKITPILVCATNLWVIPMLSKQKCRTKIKNTEDIKINTDWQQSEIMRVKLRDWVWSDETMHSDCFNVILLVYTNMKLIEYHRCEHKCNFVSTFFLKRAKRLNTHTTINPQLWCMYKIGMVIWTKKRSANWISATSVESCTDKCSAAQKYYLPSYWVCAPTPTWLNVWRKDYDQVSQVI